MAVSFDLFGTLLEADRPDDPAAAVGAELDSRGVEVPGDWGRAYRERHVDAPDGAEVPLQAHVSAALRSRDVEVPEGNVVRRAVVAAFDPEVRAREGARAALEAAAGRGPVGVLSNCSVPGLARRALLRASLRDPVDAVVTSAGCGWRKPHPGAFEAVAGALGVPVADLLHVGDDPATDGGVEDAGGRALLVEGGALSSLPDRLEG